MPRQRPRRIVFLVLPGFQLLDLAGPFDVFDVAGRTREFQGQGLGYELIVAGPTRNVVSGSGLSLGCVRFEDLPKAIDTVVVPGALEFASKTWSEGQLSRLRPVVRRARRVASVCGGAFVLNALGLLAGRRVTTHWLCLSALAEAAPRARVERDAIYARDGKIYTSAGVSTGIDLALALVEEDFGHELALSVARLLVVYLHRPGGQSQFSAALTRRRPSPGRISTILAEIVDDPAGDHRVEELARRAHMSPRNFSRIFAEQTGVSPARFVRDVRVEAARHLLERGADDLASVARTVGLGTTETLRRVFQNKLGVPPSAYRGRFEESSARGK